MKLNLKFDIYPLKLYFSRIWVILLSSTSLALNLFVWLWLWIQLPRNEEELFLHYNILFGVDYIGPSWKVYYLPFLGIIIMLVNVFLGWLLYKKDKFIAQLLNFVNLLCQIFILIGALLLIFLNT